MQVVVLPLLSRAVNNTEAPLDTITPAAGFWVIDVIPQLSVAVT
jgi:hypothetical protein